MTAEKDQYQDVCKTEFDKINDKLDDIHDKLFVGNGQPPITIQLDRLNGFKAKAYWFFGVIVIAVVGIIARFIHTRLK